MSVVLQVSGNKSKYLDKLIFDLIMTVAKKLLTLLHSDVGMDVWSKLDVYPIAFEVFPSKPQRIMMLS